MNRRGRRRATAVVAAAVVVGCTGLGDGVPTVAGTATPAPPGTETSRPSAGGDGTTAPPGTAAAADVDGLFVRVEFDQISPEQLAALRALDGVASVRSLRTSDTALFGMPEVKLGVPSVVEAALLPQLIGWGKTRWMVYTGETIDAGTALSWGLVEKVVDAGALDAAVAEWVEAIVESGPRAIRLQKELVRRWESMPVSDAIQEGIRCMGEAYETDEPRRMIEDGLAKLKARKGG